MKDPAGRLRFITPPAPLDDARYVIGRALLLVSAAIMALHAVSVVVRIRTRPEAGALADVLALLNGGHERSLASWWTAALLVTCSVAALLAARLARGDGDPRAGRAWVVLAVVFALLSLDEAVSLHERGAEWAGAVFDSGSVLARLGWTLPAAAIIVVSLAALVPAFRAIPSRSRSIIVAGLATSIAGALGMEVVNVLLVDAGARYLWRHLVMAIEEAAEMAGVVIALLGVLTTVRVSGTDRGVALAYDAGR
ncbi:hypothetical protein [Jiangella mangrovi]|uniref:Uncharacterized protein n=1 Tax=Jiangella mangrovi TaxID=1524084 RepID=A0A7W9GMU5_9ACTN|nr:hypothetical protein [Jiangella mangrovi]MBB5786607.1 hypothetical protein [Jiangella mangrovi]